MNKPKEEANISLYNVLGVQKSSSSSEIRSAYRKLAMKWHPDKCSTSEQAKNRFQNIQEAYSVLSDDNKRVLYDSGLYNEKDDEGMQSFMSEMVSMMSTSSKSSFTELKDMFDQMVDGYGCSSAAQACSSSKNSTGFSFNNPELKVFQSPGPDPMPMFFGQYNSQSFCLGRQEEDDSLMKQQRQLHKKHKRRKSPYDQHGSTRV